VRDGDCVEVIATMCEASADAVVCDPPYNLSFMGREWDSHASPRDFQGWCESWGRECLRVLKPGGHALVFGGTRTFHRLTCGLEDAGFEIRDCLMWLYGSGFPKSLNLDGEWQGWGTALKPAWEPIIVARKPLVGTVAANVLEHGTGALNVDGCRIGDEEVPINRLEEWSGFGQVKRPEYEATVGSGRWPANVALDEAAGELLDEQSGVSRSTSGSPRSGRQPGGNGWGMTAVGTEHDDEGGASRFFYCAKTSTAERNAGLDGFDESKLHDNAGHKHADERAWDIPGSHSTARANHHPTVKPIDLMRWLVRLVTPPDGLILDPFTGSGSTGCAAVLEGFRFVGVERETEYATIARARIAWWAEHPEGLPTDLILAAASKRPDSTQGSIFDLGGVV